MDAPQPKFAFDSWQSILDFYQQFLKGEVDSCPTHGGPLDPESSEILKELLEINRLGVLTIDSQPASRSFQAKARLCVGDDEEREVTDLVSLQRAYLDCYMPERLYERLAQKLLMSKFLLFAQKVGPASEDPPSMSLPVSITSYSLDGEDYDDIETAMPIGWHAPDMEFVLLDSTPEVQAEVLEDLYSVRILDPSWKGTKSRLFSAVVYCLEEED